jgi:exodeoxyribonuclease-5
MDAKSTGALWGIMSNAGQVICGTNRTRHQLNDRLRRLMGQTSSVPVAGDRVICLRNERKKGLLNGSQWLVRRATMSQDKHTVSMVIDSDDGSAAGVEVKSWVHHFCGNERQLDSMGPVRMAYQEFDFAYAITCHKAQGSQWDDVVLYDESGVFDGDTARRWIYTGITRAASRLTVVL